MCRHRYVCPTCRNQRKACVRCGAKHPHYPQSLRLGYPMVRGGDFIYLCECPDNTEPIKQLTEAGKTLAEQRNKVRERNRDMNNFKARMLRELVEDGPRDSEGFYRMKVVGKTETVWFNITPATLAKITEVIAEQGD